MSVQLKEIDPSHINNVNILTPIEDVIKDAMADYKPNGKLTNYDPATSKERLIAQAQTWFNNKNIFVLGQLLIGAANTGNYSIIPAARLERTLGDMGFALNQYIPFMISHPELKAKLLHPKHNFHESLLGDFHPSYGKTKPFEGKSREDIVNALMEMFKIDGPSLKPGSLPIPVQPRSSDSFSAEPDIDTQGVTVALTKEWREKAGQVYQRAMITQIERAIRNDPQITGEIGGAKAAALLGADFGPGRSDVTDKPDVVVLDSSQLTIGLAHYFGNVASELTSRVDRNLAARNFAIQDRAREIIADAVIRSLSLDSLK